MAFKDILVYADAAPGAASRLDFAARMAQAHGAHLTALHISAPLYIPVDILGTGVGADVEQWQQAQREKDVAQSRALIAAVRQRLGIDIEERIVVGDLETMILDHGRYSDLIVVTQDAAGFDLSQPVSPSTAGLVVAAGRPVLVLPATGKDHTAGKHILVAWKACAEATRAVHDALPLLCRADKVTVLSADTGTTGKSHIAGADMATHLARHGVKVTVAPITAPDMDVGSVILARAADLNADLIVMGGYGHSRLREMVLGGVTNHVLKNHTIPVFLAS